MVEVYVDNSEVNVVITYFDQLGQRIYDSLVSVIIDIIHELREYVITGKLSGQVLHQITGLLASSIKIDITQAPGEIRGTVFQDRATAPYGHVHEFGGTFLCPEHLRATKNGGVSIVKAHTKTFPRRSYMMSAMLESVNSIQTRLTAALEQGVRA